MQVILEVTMGMGATTSELSTIPHVLRFSEAKMEFGWSMYISGMALLRTSPQCALSTSAPLACPLGKHACAPSTAGTSFLSLCECNQAAASSQSIVAPIQAIRHLASAFFRPSSKAIFLVALFASLGFLPSIPATSLMSSFANRGNFFFRSLFPASVEPRLRPLLFERPLPALIEPPMNSSSEELSSLLL